MMGLKQFTTESTERRGRARREEIEKQERVVERGMVKEFGRGKGKIAELFPSPLPSTFLSSFSPSPTPSSSVLSLSLPSVLSVVNRVKPLPSMLSVVNRAKPLPTSISDIHLQWSSANHFDPGSVHLQWFAAEDEGRTEEPSEYKIKKAREEGRVAKSQELVGAAGLLLPALVLVVMGPWFLSVIREMLLYYFMIATEVDITTEGGLIAASFLGYFLKLALPFAIAGVVSALATNILQAGFLFSVKPITPDFSRIVPRFGQWLKKSLFSAEGLFNFAKTLVKIAVIGVVAWMTISSELGRLLSSITANFWDAVLLVCSLVARLLIEVAILLLLLSIPDYMFQRRQYLDSLKMSKEEVKEERKMMEGDPLVKGRLRERMKELLTRNMAANVPKADVVIANPTHFAVALEWDREAMMAPLVTAKGQDEIALRIRRIAEDAGVPVVENKPLARALYAEVEIGDAIPEKYYNAIAAVLAGVYAASGKAEALRGASPAGSATAAGAAVGAGAEA